MPKPRSTYCGGRPATATLTELFLDGLGERITLGADRVLTFDILVVACHRFGGGSSAGYQAAGVIRNIGGATSFVGTPIVTVLGENVAGWDVVVEAHDTAGRADGQGAGLQWDDDPLGGFGADGGGGAVAPACCRCAANLPGEGGKSQGELGLAPVLYRKAIPIASRIAP